MALLDENDTLVKRTGLHLLAKLQPPSLLVAIIPRVLALLGDGDAEVRRAVVPVLKALPPDALEDEAHAAMLVSFARPEQPDWRVRATALYAMTVLQEARLASELEEVFEQVLVEEEPSGLRFAALDVLQSLLVAAAQQGEQGEGEKAEEGAECNGDNDKDGPASAAAAAPLDCCGAGGEGQRQQEQQQQQEGNSSCSSSRGNSSRKDSPLAPVLAAQATRVIARFTDVDDRFIRWKAQSVVGSYPAELFTERPEVLSALVGCLQHEYPCTRGAGLLALGRLSPSVLSDEVLGAMAARLKDEEAVVRWASAHALKKQLAALCDAAAAGVAGAVAEEAARRLADEGEDAWVQREAHRLLVRLPENFVGSEAAATRRAWEARSEAAVDEVMEDSEAVAAAGGWGARGGGSGDQWSD